MEWRGRRGDVPHATGLLARWRLNRRWKANRAVAACSFCRKPQAEVANIIAGPRGVYICNECIALCNDIIAENLAAPTNETPPAE